jgi:adenosine deaminase
MLRTIATFILGVLLFASLAQAQSESTAEQRTARYLESIRQSPPQQLAFFMRMPKGGDLHNHLSGAVYAESYLKWAAEKDVDKQPCVNTKTLVMSLPPCNTNADQIKASDAQNNVLVYRQLIDAWSMRNWNPAVKNGHDQFFDTFVKFGVATYDQTGPMLAEVAARAARGNVLYLELMLTPDGGLAGQIGRQVKFDGLESTLNSLKAANIKEAVEAGLKNLRSAESQKDALLRCKEKDPDPGCSVTIRYVSQVSRGSDPNVVYAQMVTGMMLANDPGSKVVAINLVQPEDWLVATRDFSLHMSMLAFLKGQFPNARLSLHAGELAPGVVKPEDLSFHIRDSVEVAGAKRIGHGVDIMHETQPYTLMKKMAAEGILVEICLSSNDLILGIRGADHPLAVYLKYGVPLALATDDEGVSRSEISREYLKGAQEQGLNYIQLKSMARNSLTFAFIDGSGLWRDARKFVPVAECASDLQNMAVSSKSCRQFLDQSAKARLQWRLEEQFKAFEKEY